MKKENYLADLKTIVDIASYTDDKLAVNKVNDFFVEKFNALGLVVERYQNSLSGDLLVVRSALQDDSPKILLSGHTDIVRLPGFVPFSMERDKCYGSGVADMKSGLIVMLGILQSLKEEDQLKNITVVLMPDEETGSSTYQKIVNEIYQVQDYAFVFEPSLEMVGVNRNLVTERKGLCRYEIKLYGDGGHSGNKLENRNSTIEELARKILKWQALTDIDNGISTNVGIVKGGSGVNVIASYVEALLEVRMKSIKDTCRLDDLIRDIASEHTLNVREEFSRYLNIPPMVEQAKTSMLKEVINQAFNRQGIQASYALRGGASDGNQIAQFGVATIDGLGGVGGGMHSENEWMMPGSIPMSVKAVSEAIKIIFKSQK